MKGLFVFSHHMEDVEALGTKALLSRAGLEMTSITFENTREITTAFKTKTMADCFGLDVTYDDYDFVVIPGGKYVGMTIHDDIEIQKIAKYFDSKGKLVAAICAAPRYLGRQGILNGKSFTAYTGSEKDAPLGKYLPHMKAIRDKNIITARSAGSIYEFAFEIVSYLLGEDHAKALFTSILF
jgi:4-methyl-5(b-hydroxyethyl)-thiazole monophosphate biosynthesis